MTKTTNYQLSQWDADDPIRRADFNADNDALDAALGAQAAALAKCGNCRIETGTYEGTGTTGYDGAISLTFSGAPLLVFITSTTTVSSSQILVLMRDGISGPVINGSGGSSVTWDGNTISWYATTVGAMMNNHQTVYRYIALIAADAD